MIDIAVKTATIATPGKASKIIYSNIFMSKFLSAISVYLYDFFFKSVPAHTKSRFKHQSWQKDEENRMLKILSKIN